MKQILRAFSLGILSACIVMLITYYLGHDEKQIELTTNEMIQKLESEGYFITKKSVEETETDQNQSNQESAEKKEENQPEVEEEPNREEQPEIEEDPKVEEDPKAIEKDEPATYTLRIEPGMSLATIVQMLHAAKIIEDPNEFSAFLEENNYSTKVQIGEFNLTSDMTHEEVAETIANQ
ncbi:hypothetical protein [Aquibacillus kalidii]|uniref:hypothetical protein n=1 Tax=Aquibacillus kalidii TaxID=2762597 RepID=UPI001645D2C7|nr:hypothetical protein [Aquibacillus kalidii]